MSPACSYARSCAAAAGYRTDSHPTCTIYPITNETYLGIFAKHAGAYLMTLVVLLVFLFYLLKALYKKPNSAAQQTTSDIIYSSFRRFYESLLNRK